MIAAAVCPQAPALVPDVGQGVADELVGAREACLDALASVMAANPDRFLVLGPGAPADEWDESAGGTFQPFGPDVRAGGADLVLPPSLTVGAWLLDAVGWNGPRTYTSLGSVARYGHDVVLLVMADGSSRHRRLAPEWADVEGRAFDASVARALRDGDASALANLDLDAAAEYGASGVEGLITLGEMTKDASVAAQLRYDGAPFDVGYWVADWQLS